MFGLKLNMYAYFSATWGSNRIAVARHNLKSNLNKLTWQDKG